LELRSGEWHVEPLTIERAESSFFAGFPRGTVELDSALLMRNVPHEWRAKAPLMVSAVGRNESPGRSGGFPI